MVCMGKRIYRTSTSGLDSIENRRNNMKYLGSKSRIAKDIVPIIQRYIDEVQPVAYLEPFVGGAMSLTR